MRAPFTYRPTPKPRFFRPSNTYKDRKVKLCILLCAEAACMCPNLLVVKDYERVRILFDFFVLYPIMLSAAASNFDHGAVV